jgi:hypothetical protein
MSEVIHDINIENISGENNIIFDKEDDIFYFECPHEDCKMMIQVPRNEIRCTIFRHAVFKNEMKFVPPHASKEECERWLRENLVFGCAKPFKFDGNKVEICGYI